MATFDYISTAGYSQAGNSDNFNRDVAPADASGTLDDGEPDMTFEFGDPLGHGTFYGTITSGEGHILVVVFIEGGPSPSADDLVIYSPVPMSQVTFPSSVTLGSDVDTSVFTVCFAAGTRIAVPGGARNVEDLKIGDLVLTGDGRAIPVRWLGRQTVRPRFQGARVQPVRIRRGALGDGLPDSDLTVTADHGMVIDGLVINASALVNGTTIDFVAPDELCDRVVYYHIETENHETVLANGIPTETFVDYTGRQAFDNYAEYIELYGAERLIFEMDRPRVSAQRLVPEAIRARLGIGAEAAFASSDLWAC